MRLWPGIGCALGRVLNLAWAYDGGTLIPEDFQPTYKPVYGGNVEGRANEPQSAAIKTMGDSVIPAQFGGLYGYTSIRRGENISANLLPPLLLQPYARQLLRAFLWRYGCVPPLLLTGIFNFDAVSVTEWHELTGY